MNLLKYRWKHYSWSPGEFSVINLGRILAWIPGIIYEEILWESLDVECIWFGLKYFKVLVKLEYLEKSVIIFWIYSWKNFRKSYRIIWNWNRWRKFCENLQEISNIWRNFKMPLKKPWRKLLKDNLTDFFLLLTLYYGEIQPLASSSPWQNYWRTTLFFVIY